MRKHEKEVRKVARAHGAELEYRRSHFRLIFPNGRQLTTACSPTNPEHSLKRLQRDIERYIHAPTKPGS